MFYNLKIKEKKKCNLLFLCYNDNGDDMKIALISDVHSNITALKKAIKDAKNNQVDEFFFLGDYITDGPGSNEVMDLIKQYGSEVFLGNRERNILNYDSSKKDYNNTKPMDYTYHELLKENMDYIKTLPDKKIIQIGKYKTLVWHGDELIDRKGGLLNDFDKIIYKYDFDICIFGHTHMYTYLTYKNHIFLNPGSIGLPFDTPYYKYVILDIDDEIKISLRQFDVQNDYLEIKEKYEQSEYYKKNTIWGDLILKQIYNGKCYVSNFIKFLNKRIKDKKISPDLYNNIWNEQYQIFLKNYNEIDLLRFKQYLNANEIGSIYDLYHFIHDQVTFGWIDVQENIHKDLNNLYYLQTPIEVMEHKIGRSMDVIEFIRFFFDMFVTDTETYYFCSNNDFFSSHSIFVYYENDKVYWYEPFLGKESGIYEYHNIDELLENAEEKIKLYLKIQDSLEVYLYDELKYHIDLKRAEEYIKDGIKIK